MPKEKLYQDIHTKLTLDRRKDGTADTRMPNEFQILKNYLPTKGGIYTREGITIFSHTPASTGPWNPIDNPTYSADGETAVCRMILTFCSDATIGDNALDSTTLYSALNSVSESGYATTTTVRSKHGNSCIIMHDDTAENTGAGGSAQAPRVYGLRTANIFPAWMPGDSAETTNVCLVTYWFWPYSAGAATNAEWHCTFGNTGTANKLAFGTRHFDNNLQGYYADSAGASTNIGRPGVVAEQKWNFAAFWVDAVNLQSGVYHYNDETGVEDYTTAAVAPMDHFYHHSTANTINGKYSWNGIDGNYCDPSDAGHIFMDYFTLWDSLFTNNTSNVTLVRAIRDLHKA